MGGQLILRKISRLKCTKFNFGWGSALTPLGELTALYQA